MSASVAIAIGEPAPLAACIAVSIRLAGGGEKVEALIGCSPSPSPESLPNLIDLRSPFLYAHHGDTVKHGDREWQPQPIDTVVGEIHLGQARAQVTPCTRATAKRAVLAEYGL
jgi:hypothetical protein